MKKSPEVRGTAQKNPKAKMKNLPKRKRKVTQKPEVKEVTQERFTIPRPRLAVLVVKIVGLTPLIMNRMTNKAREQIAEGQEEKKTPKKRQPRTPHQDFLNSMHRHGKHYAFPASAFKKVMVNACGLFDKSVAKTFLRATVFVSGDLTPEFVQITGTKPHMREDVVRRPPRIGKADIAYRGQFDEWGCTLTIRFLEGFITKEMILNLLAFGGISFGIGEMRPSSESCTSYGQFELEEEAA
jgi:hypothetical protein